MTETEISHFNVFESQLERIEYHGEPVDFRLLHRSDDGRKAVFFSSNGGTPVRFTEEPANLSEAFYIVEGTVKCTTQAGESIVWGRGDLVFWPYADRLELEYSSDLKSVCFFWSDEELPDFSSAGALT